MEEKFHTKNKLEKSTENKVGYPVKKKKASIEDLLIKNLIHTNMTLLKSMDLRSIVLF